MYIIFLRFISMVHMYLYTTEDKGYEFESKHGYYTCSQQWGGFPRIAKLRLKPDKSCLPVSAKNGKDNSLRSTLCSELIWNCVNTRDTYRQWCGSALIVCESGSTKFDECRFRSRTMKLISNRPLNIKRKKILILYLNLRWEISYIFSSFAKKTKNCCFSLHFIPLWTRIRIHITACRFMKRMKWNNSYLSIEVSGSV